MHVVHLLLLLLSDCTVEEYANFPFITVFITEAIWHMTTSIKIVFGGFLEMSDGWDMIMWCLLVNCVVLLTAKYYVIHVDSFRNV